METAAAADGRSRAVGRSSLLTQGSLNKAMLCSKPLHFCAGGSRRLSPSWLLHLSPALDPPGLLCPSCAGVGQGEAQRSRDWFCVGLCGWFGSRLGLTRPLQHLEPEQFWKNPAPPILGFPWGRSRNKLIQNISGAQGAPGAGGAPCPG